MSGLDRSGVGFRAMHAQPAQPSYSFPPSAVLPQLSHLMTQVLAVKLDCGKLGVREGLSARDVWGPKRSYTLKSDWRDEVPPWGFRLIVFR